MSRQIALDTETTGLSAAKGHRIIEIAGVEIIDRQITDRHFQVYINPKRKVDQGAYAVHKIGDDFLKDKPLFTDVVDSFIEFIRDAELIIHNAPFDVGFLDHELKRLPQKYTKVNRYAKVFDTLVLARQLHPGQKNTLDALCKRYQVPYAHRTQHGALLDSRLLAQVYLAMTSGQSNLFNEETSEITVKKEMLGDYKTSVLAATSTEEKAHQQYMDFLSKEKTS